MLIQKERLHPAVPTLHEVQTKRVVIYSDHLPLHHTLKLDEDKIKLNVIHWKLMAPNTPCGFSAENNWEADIQIKERCERIIYALTDFVATLQANIILLQEAELLNDAILENFFKKPDWHIIAENSMIILFRSNILTPIENSYEYDDQCQFENTVCGIKQKQTFTVQGSDKQLDIMNVHTPTFSDYRKVERLYNFWFNQSHNTDTKCITIIAGDTGAYFAPPHSSRYYNHSRQIQDERFLTTSVKLLANSTNQQADFSQALFYSESVNQISYSIYTALDPYNSASANSIWRASATLRYLSEQASGYIGYGYGSDWNITNQLRSSLDSASSAINSGLIKRTKEEILKFLRFMPLSVIDSISVAKEKSFLELEQKFNETFQDANIRLIPLVNAYNQRIYAIWVPVNSSQMQIIETKIAGLDNLILERNNEGLLIREDSPCDINDAKFIYKFLLVMMLTHKYQQTKSEQAKLVVGVRENNCTEFQAIISDCNAESGWPQDVTLEFMKADIINPEGDILLVIDITKLVETNSNEFQSRIEQLYNGNANGEDRGKNKFGEGILIIDEQRKYYMILIPHENIDKIIRFFEKLLALLAIRKEIADIQEKHKSLGFWGIHPKTWALTVLTQKLDNKLLEHGLSRLDIISEWEQATDSVADKRQTNAMIVGQPRNPIYSLPYTLKLAKLFGIDPSATATNAVIKKFTN